MSSQVTFIVHFSVCFPTRTVQLQRTALGTLGFSIVGGSDGTHGCDAIYIKYVVPSSPAAKQTRLRCVVKSSVDHYNAAFALSA